MHNANCSGVYGIIEKNIYIQRLINRRQSGRYGTDKKDIVVNYTHLFDRSYRSIKRENESNERKSFRNAISPSIFRINRDCMSGGE